MEKRLFLFMCMAVIVLSCNNKTGNKKNIENLEVILNEGNLTNLMLPNDDIGFSVQASNYLDKCEDSGNTFTNQQLNKSGTIEEKWIEGKTSIDWTISVNTADSAWTTGIFTEFQFDDPENLLFWTTWGNPDHARPVNTEKEMDMSWKNPFDKRPFANRLLFYGEHCCLGASFSVPLFSVFDKNSDKGFTILMSPHDDLFDVRLITTKEGKVQIQRFNNRISKEHSPAFTMHIFPHGNDWREILAMVVEKYPEYFKPEYDGATSIAGCGAYSTYEGKIDTSVYNKIGGIVNWKASYDFSYMGMFLPDVKNDNETWRRFSAYIEEENNADHSDYNSIQQMAAYAKELKDLGYNTLSYFNVTEFGVGITYPKSNENHNFKYKEYEQANRFLYDSIPNSILFGTHDQESWLSRDSMQQIHPKPLKRDKPYYTWGDAVATDIGDPAYQSFILRMAKKHVDKLPDISGIAIDRLDWLGEYNHCADDGKSMVGSYKTRAVQDSWKTFMEKLAPIMHHGDKAIFCNPHIAKAEYLEHIDGVFHEGAFVWNQMNTTSFLCLFKPFINWARNGKVYEENGKTIYEYPTFSNVMIKTTPDDFLQKQIFMGVFPMAPFPQNNHSILPESGMLPYYIEYGEMLKALKGRKWVLIPNVIKSDDAMANIFEVPGGFIVPVIQGGNEAQVTISGIEINKDNLKVLHPGKTEKTLIGYEKNDSEIQLNVPLVNGCAMVLIENNN